jgi:hypothetical protein
MSSHLALAEKYAAAASEATKAGEHALAAAFYAHAVKLSALAKAGVTTEAFAAAQTEQVPESE